VLSQTYQDFEIIVVNDGSTDDSEQRVLSINNDKIKLFTIPNQGVSAARNVGIEKSSNDLIALLDGDDIWDDTFLQEMVDFITEFPNASLYGCAYSFMNNNNISTPNLGFEPNFKSYLDNYFVIAKNNTLFSSSSVVFRKHDFYEVGIFDENLTRGEDIDLWFRFALKRRVAYYNKPLAYYRLESENRAMNKFVSHDKCLIWSLKRYSSYEINNPEFKMMLDNWRLAHISNFMYRTTTEIDEITPLLKQMDLKNYSFLWTILRYTPRFLQRFVYFLWLKLRTIIKSFKNDSK